MAVNGERGESLLHLCARARGCCRAAAESSHPPHPPGTKHCLLTDARVHHVHRGSRCPGDSRPAEGVSARWPGPGEPERVLGPPPRAGEVSAAGAGPPYAEELDRGCGGRSLWSLTKMSLLHFSNFLNIHPITMACSLKSGTQAHLTSLGTCPANPGGRPGRGGGLGGREGERWLGGREVGGGGGGGLLVGPPALLSKKEETT